jgi:hypothetical protein
MLLERPSAMPSRSSHATAGFKRPQQNCDGVGLVCVGRTVATRADRLDHGGLIGVTLAGNVPLQARAMQRWIDRGGIARRPMPKLGETAQERAERQTEALVWGLDTGAVPAVVQAYRQARDRGESELTAFNAAADAALALGRPLDKINDTARVLIEWAAKAKRH